ncbi:hypothetical protein PFISCL1PPCAC_13414, partial [Pristionchus fissidentatus]
SDGVERKVASAHTYFCAERLCPPPPKTIPLPPEVERYHYELEGPEIDDDDGSMVYSCPYWMHQLADWGFKDLQD